VTYIVMLGTAGSGKTLLTKAYAEWLRNNGYGVAIVNLDPGVRKLPYKPDLDIREYFTVEEIMEKYNLGPNGAFMKASDMLLKYSNKILLNKVFTRKTHDFVIIDTPGQMEMFVYRRSGQYFISKLKKFGAIVGVFIVDGENVNSHVDLVVSWMTSILVQLKLDIPVIPIVNKVDLVKNRKILEIFINDPERFKEKTLESKEGLIADTAVQLIDVIRDYSQSLRPILVSAKTFEGLEDLHYVVHEVFCTCGDLT